MHLSNMHFFYDAQGKPCQVNRGGTIYNYVLNLQGDVVGLTDTAGNLVVEYKYDAWGKLLGISGSLATSLGTANPLRYRGYVYDNETGLYYLHSRYYDPEARRFICADDIVNMFAQEHILANNLYAYCVNNHVMCADPSGKLSITAEGWSIGMSWLLFIDGPLPIGDSIYGIGLFITGISSLAVQLKM